MIKSISLLTIITLLACIWQSCTKDKNASGSPGFTLSDDTIRVKAYFTDDSRGTPIPGLSLQFVEQVGLNNGRLYKLETDSLGTVSFRVRSDWDLLVSIHPEDSASNYFMRNFKLIIGNYPYANEQPGGNSILPGPTVYQYNRNAEGELVYRVRVPGRSELLFDVRQEAPFTRQFQDSKLFFEGTLYLYDTSTNFNLQRMDVVTVELPDGQTMKDLLTDVPVYAGKTYRFDWSAFEYKAARTYYEEDSLRVFSRDVLFINSLASSQARKVDIRF